MLNGSRWKVNDLLMLAPDLDPLTSKGYYKRKNWTTLMTRLKVHYMRYEPTRISGDGTLTQPTSIRNPSVGGRE